MADIKNFGIKGLSSDVQMGKSGGRLKYDSGSGQFDFTQSNGSTLENVRFGSVVAGSWTGTAVGSQYGGTGQDLSSSSGIIKVSSGTMSAASTISLTSEVAGTLPIANGGTGGTSASGARTGLGLGSIATQDITSVTLTGGTMNAVVIGGTTAAAGSFTTINASGAITGALSGNATTATALATGRTIGMSGDGTWTSASFTGAGNVTGAMTLATVNSNVGSFGSTSAIPVVTVNAKGLVTGVTTASIVTSLTVDGDTGAQNVDLSADDLQFIGTANEIATAVTKVGTDVKVTIGLPDDVTIGGDLTVSGAFNSDDITASTVTINGNLVVSGTTTTVNSSVTTLTDPVMHVGQGSLAAGDANDRGVSFEYGDGSAVKDGFFGMDIQTGRFTFDKDLASGSADDDEFSSPWGDAQFHNLYLDGSLDITGNSVTDGTGKVTGMLTADGGINTSAGDLTIAPAGGDTTVTGTLTASGAFNAASATLTAALPVASGGTGLQSYTGNGYFISNAGGTAVSFITGAQYGILQFNASNVPVVSSTIDGGTF